MAGSVSILIFGFVFSSWFTFQKIPKLFEEIARGALPPSLEATLPQAKRYTLWVYVKGRMAGKEYTSIGQLPPGAKIYIFDRDSARELPLEINSSSTLNRNGERAISFGEFEADRAGQRVEVAVTGLRMPLLVGICASNTEEVVLILLEMTGMVLLSLALSIFGFNFSYRRNKLGNR
ncbi:MAG: hypothetical protein P1U68_04480 [Verrucomicrobiales bacterium]|nr:hypothetical protein [Verrucomicrobiales bacterium]